MSNVMNFFDLQDVDQKEYYIELLKVTGALSNLFADSSNPFLYYRAMENIFCKAFEAENLSRSDVSADAKKGNIGIGLKTFLHNNGKTFQKVAEFNRHSDILREMDREDIVYKVAELRNERIRVTMNLVEVSEMMYHSITRSENSMQIYEEEMNPIDISRIKILKSGSKNTIHFDDGINEYNFSLSKSTLLKRFYTEESSSIAKFRVDILEDPFDFLLDRRMEQMQYLIEESTKKKDEVKDYIVLPLYSPRDGMVQEKSGLNQWNAGGRARHPYEAYIPIPAWIHRAKKGFFTYSTEDFKTEPFDVKLPSGKILSMKIAQQGGKALMSNPNRELGEWLIRDILELKKGTLVTRNKLDDIGIDSVKLSKMIDGSFELDFLESGSYEEFEEQFS